MFENIAIALIGAIGDVILSTPLVEAVRSAFPMARLTYMVGEKAAPVLYHLPAIDELLLIDDRLNPGPASAIKLLNEVRRRRFDVAICLTRSERLSLILWLARVPRRIGFTPLRTAWSLTDAIDSTREPVASMHRTEYFLAAATALNIPHPRSIRLHYAVSAQERNAAFLRLLKYGINSDSETLVGIHPGTSRISIEKRRWTADGFIGVALHLVRTGRRVLLFGGPDETALCKVISDALGAGVIDLSGQLELREFAAVLERCKLLIHHDSSPLHLAGAVGVPVVAIFGYQNPKHWGPLVGSGQVVRLDLPCSPCEQDFRCDRSFECVRQLPVSQVLKEVEAQLELISTPPE